MESFGRKIEDARDAVKKDDRNSQGQEIEFADPVRFLSTVSFSELPETPVLQAPITDTTISVLNVERVRLRNTGAVTVTNLTNGQEGQSVIFLGDGFTTFQNNSNIGTNTAANKLLAAGATYTFTRLNSKWIEAAASGSSYTAGTGLVLTGAAFSNPYVGKAVTLIASTISFTASAGLNQLPGSVTYATKLNTLNMTSMRVSTVFSMSGGNTFDFYIQYSTNNGSSWTNIVANLGLFNGDSNKLSSNSVTFPVAARNANTWLRPAYITDFGGGTVTFSGLHLEFTP